MSILKQFTSQLKNIPFLVSQGLIFASFVYCLTISSARLAHAQKKDRIAEILKITFAKVPAGTFHAKLCKDCDEQTVFISQPFEMSAHEITQDQWTKVMGASSKPWDAQPYAEPHPSHPATYISWDQIKIFMGVLNSEDSRYHYSLPTSAEWEHACRAGSKTRFSFGNDTTSLKIYAQYSFNTVEQRRRYPHPVGQKLPNNWGLFDLHGNVAEWVSDSAIRPEDVKAGILTDPKFDKPNSKVRLARGSHFAQTAEDSAENTFIELDRDKGHLTIGFRIIRRPLPR